MYVTLFNLAGPAVLAWVLMIFVPKWRGTRWLVRSAIVPALLAVLYVIGIALLISENGMGFMRDFGNAEGVAGLMARPEIALVAWIHFLVFDQLVGIFIFRDNMHHRYVPIPVQSVILFLTFMLGPVGFLSYYVIRWVRSGSLGGRREETGVTEAVASGAKLGSLPLAEIIRRGWERLMETRALTAGGFAGIILGLICLAVMAVRQGVPIPPEGDLSKPVSFNIAVGIYLLTIALLVPSAGFSERGKKRWIRWNVALFAYAYTIETVQAFRGLDPRFSKHGTPWDQIAGGVFFLAALGTLVLFIIMAVRFFRRGRPDAASPILLAIRYGSAAAIGAFIAGIWMSVIGGRTTGPAGNVLPLHALGSHGLQAVPLIALLLLWSGYDSRETRKWVHATGIVWVAACAAVAWQTIAGRSVSEISAAPLVTAFLLAVWVGIGLFAFWRWAATPIIPRESPGT